MRVEQLFPMPDKQIDAIVKKYPGAEYVWTQEEPKNMGAWTYWLRRPEHLSWQLISRPPSSSPAVGFSKTHQAQQLELVDQAFGEFRNQGSGVRSQGSVEQGRIE